LEKYAGCYFDQNSEKMEIEENKDREIIWKEKRE